mmetsp:Transcript_60697/g.162134  ORF Transcript_60697/g.162134 Transcript_60697/m.162134 type:complete len:158 (-) Transcript_60697:1302-1775(-)
MIAFIWGLDLKHVSNRPSVTGSNDGIVFSEDYFYYPFNNVLIHVRGCSKEYDISLRTSVHTTCRQFFVSAPMYAIFLVPMSTYLSTPRALPAKLRMQHFLSELIWSLNNESQLSMFGLSFKSLRNFILKITWMLLKARSRHSSPCLCWIVSSELKWP